ncbi:MAG: DNA cytosine methyltransferase [Nitrosopumilus sp.]|nr:DNA cytosine methyltransferase [Nitrosopumilus sp.]
MPNRILPTYEKLNIKYTVIKLFAGAGGPVLGLERAGISCNMMSEIDKHACTTLRVNRPQGNFKRKPRKRPDKIYYSVLILPSKKV